MSEYQISVPESAIEDLKKRLSLTRFPDELDAAGWDYGAPLADVKRLAKYWETGFDWRKAEAKMNELPNYHRKLKADGFPEIDIHYVYQKSSSADAIPLLFIHGWPGSFIEVTKLLPSLTQSTNGVSFHVVALSLPNFGFSEGVKQKGFGLREYATICHRLMQSLGYDKYVTQGGDWGKMISRTMGLLYPGSCLASHINLVRSDGPPKWTQQPLLALQHAVTPYSEYDKAGFERSKWFLEEGSGYRWEQSTKPQTLGYCLADSPVALLAWIWEKLHDWTDNYPWTDDEILTWISIYWFSTAGPAANLRIYYEATHVTSAGGIHRTRTQQWIPKVKLGLFYAPKELSVIPKTWGRTLGPVVFESQKSKGGHFAAWEIPDEITSDLQKMFGKGGACYRIVSSDQSKL